MKVIALVQARLGSVRLPEKVLRQITDKPLIELLLTRLSCSTEIDKIVVATSEEPLNNKLQLFVESLGFQCSRGSEKDVLKRFYESAKHFNADIVVRITGDCPLIDSRLVDQCIQGFKDANVDYFSNIDPTTFPDGLDVEVMSFIALERAHLAAVSSLEQQSPVGGQWRSTRCRNLTLQGPNRREDDQHRKSRHSHRSPASSEAAFALRGHREYQ